VRERNVPTRSGRRSLAFRGLMGIEPVAMGRRVGCAPVGGRCRGARPGKVAGYALGALHCVKRGDGDAAAMAVLCIYRGIQATRLGTKIPTRLILVLGCRSWRAQRQSLKAGVVHAGA